MPRKTVIRYLPLLQDIKGLQAPIPEDVNRGAVLEQQLRFIIQRLRSSATTPFYSMRDIAEFFGVSLKTVAVSYRKLHSEGLLQIRRGSKTLLPGKQSTPTHPIRGRVCIPTWTTGFRIYNDWQHFFALLEEHLLAQDYVTQQIFFDEDSIGTPFLERIIAHRPDWVFWPFPDIQQRETLQRIEDAGLRLAVLGDRPGTIFPGQKYSLNWKQALMNGFKDWAQNGIRRVIIPGNPTADNSLTHFSCSMLTEFGLTCEFRPPRRDVSFHEFSSYLNELPRDAETGYLFDDDILFTLTLIHFGPQILDLFESCRCMIGRPLPFAPLHLEGLTVDALTPDWQEIAQRIAGDLTGGDVFLIKERVTFQAQWHSRVQPNSLLKHRQATIRPSYLPTRNIHSQA